jgi:hypothetical protein
MKLKKNCRVLEALKDFSVLVNKFVHPFNFSIEHIF